MRSALLVGSESRWLRKHVSHLPLVRRAVTRFLPGERVEDAVAAAIALGERGIGAVLTNLGENVTDAATADATTRHYVEVCAAARAGSLACHISVKLTQLGLDVDAERCRENLFSLAEETKRNGIPLWIDMEQSSYVDRTLEMYRRTLREFQHVGVCLQAYLYRTAGDLASLVRIGGGVRLVKGAYREPASVAYPRKKDVDENFFALATQMIAPDTRAAGLRAVFGTHDHRLISRIQRCADTMEVGPEAFEFHLLFGIGREEQVRLSRDGYRVRVLISYGEQWFPWYMRRLAERPANLLFVAKSMLSR